MGVMFWRFTGETLGVDLTVGEPGLIEKKIKIAIKIEAIKQNAAKILQSRLKKVLYILFSISRVPSKSKY